MTGNLTVLSWNVQGEVGIGAERLTRQLDFLDEHTVDVDVFLFQAVNSEHGSPAQWEGHLGSLLDYFSERGYHVVHTGDWAQELAGSTVQPHADIVGSHNRCNLTASRWPIRRRPLTLRNQRDGTPQRLNYYYSHFPEKVLVSEVDVSDDDCLDTATLEVWNVGIINGSNWGEEKLNMLETVYARVYLQAVTDGVPLILGGDFNAPKQETADGTIVPHGENAGQYTTYPFYGDPHYLRDSTGELGELRFEQRWQLAEARIFDSGIGRWGMRDAYWAAEEGRKTSSVDDYTHIVHSASPSRKRLDHILVSDQFEVNRCVLWNGEDETVDGLTSSDHAPVLAELRI